MVAACLRMWTIQSAAAWKQLDENGFLRADPDLVDRDFLPAYEWMAERLAEVVPPPAGCVLPLWAWYRWHGEKRRRPDLRAAGHLPPGERGVRIAFSISSSEVLLSDFDAWHAVLNRHPHIRDDEDYETVMQQYEALKGREKQDFLERTWQGIFLKPGVHWPEDLSIQGVFWELRREQVAEATPFRAR